MGQRGNNQGEKIQTTIYLCRMGYCSIEEEAHNFGKDNGRKTPCHVFSLLLLCLRKCYMQTQKWEFLVSNSGLRKFCRDGSNIEGSGSQNVVQ